MIDSLSEYATRLNAALLDVDASEVEKAITILVHANYDKRQIYTCGNGGSAAISNHLVCDCVKGVACDTLMHPKITSLNCNDSMLTAIANDIGYEHTFSKQLEWSASTNDVLIVISSSGNSPNIINALEIANKLGMTTIAIVGFDGGKAMDLSDCCIRIPSNNYGIVEDGSQAIMHYIAQTIRSRHTTKDPEALIY